MQAPYLHLKCTLHDMHSSQRLLPYAGLTCTRCPGAEGPADAQLLKIVGHDYVIQNFCKTILFLFISESSPSIGPKNISSRIWSDKGIWLGYWKQKSKPKEIWFGWNVFPNQENTQVWMFFPPNNKIVGIIRAVKRKPAFQFWQMIYLSSGQCTVSLRSF